MKVLDEKHGEAYKNFENAKTQLSHAEHRVIRLNDRWHTLVLRLYLGQCFSSSTDKNWTRIWRQSEEDRWPRRSRQCQRTRISVQTVDLRSLRRSIAEDARRSQWSQRWIRQSSLDRTISTRDQTVLQRTAEVEVANGCSQRAHRVLQTQETGTRRHACRMQKTRPRSSISAGREDSQRKWFQSDRSMSRDPERDL